MPVRWKSGDVGFILVSNRQVRPVEIVGGTKDFCTVRFVGSGLYGGAVRLRISRLFRTAKEAEEAIILPVPSPARY